MGAGVFVMAELVRVPYTDIMVAALLPAILFFLAAWFGVHVYALRIDLPALPRSAMPGWANVARLGAVSSCCPSRSSSARWSSPATRWPMRRSSRPWSHGSRWSSNPTGACR